MRVDQFDFELPEQNIALHQADPRDSAAMLIINENGLGDEHVRDLLTHLKQGDVLVMNDTRVLPADLKGTRTRNDATATISINLHKRETRDSWLAFAKPAKRLIAGDRIVFDGLIATVAEKRQGGEVRLRFDQSGPALDEAIKARGAMPLPPYIGAKRALTKADEETYQTVYARIEGAVAAPTAGLHFTQELLAEIEAKGVALEYLTLHVGAGTFLPMKVDDTQDHIMHSEWGTISPESAARINAAKKAGGRIVAVGTTSLRLLESAADNDGILHPFSDETDIFITPGYRFKITDMLMTNFHLPKSTLFMLVCAFAGMDEMKAAYAHAIKNNYRFYSYGDASLLTCKEHLVPERDR